MTRRNPDAVRSYQEALNASAVTAPDLPSDHHHLYRCEECGLLVDRRDLGDVLHHERCGHELRGPLLGIGFIEPMLPTLVREAPEGEEWLHEIKYDGYRTQIVIDGADMRAFTRNGFDWTDRYRPVLRAAGALDCSSAILDGEMIVQDEVGRSDFNAFRTALDKEPERVVFMAFDLLHLNGSDLRGDALIDRRRQLQDLVGCHQPGCCIQYSEHVSGSGAAMFEAADKLGLEGIVSKKIGSRYRSGRSRSWLKVKCFAEEDFVVIGVQRGEGGPPTALLARERAGALAYVGGAAVTLGGLERDRFWRDVERLSVPTPALELPRSTGANWLKPAMRVRARFLKGSDKLRHATLLCVAVDRVLAG